MGDFKGAWNSFADSKDHNIFQWKKDHKEITKGVKQIGEGMKLVAKGVGDCHVKVIAKLLTKLAAKLGIAPVFGPIVEALDIFIEGKSIFNEIGDACEDF